MDNNKIYVVTGGWYVDEAILLVTSDATEAFRCFTSEIDEADPSFDGNPGRSLETWENNIRIENVYYQSDLLREAPYVVQDDQIKLLIAEWNKSRIEEDERRVAMKKQAEEKNEKDLLRQLIDKYGII